MKPYIRFLSRTLTAGFIALLTINPAWAQSNSHARIVRLSFVEGDVTVQRPDVQAWAEAPVNTPLQEGFKLSTGENSFAEIQFENGGTIRLGQLSLLDFPVLELAPNGGKINHVELHQGYATFHPLSSRLGESLQVGTPYGTLIAQGGAEFRVDLDPGLERVEVFQGGVAVQSNLGAMTLEKDSVLVMQPGTSDPTVVSQGITKDDWDQWVDNREDRTEVSPNGPSPDTYTDDAAEAPYGWSDLQQYGSWSDVPGEGFGWIPWAATGWAPYASGQWCWYPGWGYTWIGSEPWGWLPYHYGGWKFLPGTGWVWFPGSFRTWSPSRVTWFHGPNWVGWIPRQDPKDGAIACGNNCGGGAVSTSTFRHGGLLTSNLMLGFNPTTGERVKEPGIIPSTAAKLPGRAVSLPAAQSQGLGTKPAHTPMGAGIPNTATTTSSGSRRATATPSNSTIVYDPQHDDYINGHRVTTPQQSPATQAATSAPIKPAANPRSIQPVPAGSRDTSGRPAGNQESPQPNSTGISFAKQAPSGSNSNPSGGRAAAGGSQAGGSHVGGGSAGSHSSPPPAGGGHAGGAPAGGGHH